MWQHSYYLFCKIALIFCSGLFIYSLPQGTPALLSLCKSTYLLAILNELCFWSYFSGHFLHFTLNCHWMKNVLPWLVCYQSGVGDITWYTGKVEGCTGESSLFRLYKLPSAQGAENWLKSLYTLPCTQVYLPIISIKIMQIVSEVSQADLLSISFDLLI